MKKKEKKEKKGKRFIIIKSSREQKTNQMRICRVRNLARH